MERLDAGEIVIGDGGFVFALEKRGYVKAGPWTPEATMEYPEAGTIITSTTVLAQCWRSCRRGFNRIYLSCSLCFSATAAQRVPEGGL